MNRIFLVFLVWVFSQSLFAQRMGKVRLLAADVIYFSPGKWDLNPIYTPRLSSCKDLLTAYRDAYLVIHSHTDSIGSYRDNEALAEKRAQVVLDFFRNTGIDTSRLNIRSLGEYSPLEDDGTEEGRAKNRCVTMYIMAPFDESEFFVNCTIKGQLRDAKTGAPLIGKVLLNHLNGKDTLYTNENGEYGASIDLESYIEVRAYVKGYFFVSKVVKTKNKETFVTDFNLERAIIGGKMLFNDLYFVSDSPILLPASERSLRGILTFLEENDNLKIEIAGHINRPDAPPVEESSSSFQLSVNRAKTVYDYFVSKGIPANRLTYKGYGNSEPINLKPETEYQRQMNRRVELKVVE